MKRSVLSIVLCIFCFAPILAQQKVTVPPPSGSKAVFSSHRGSYSRLHLGIYSCIMMLPSEGKLASHPGFDLGYQIGGGVSDNFVLFFNLDYVFAPNYAIIQSLNTHTGILLDANLGIGGTYYFTPGDVFVSVSGNVSVYEFLTNDDSNITCKPGPGVILSVGKDWHVSNRMRFGVAYSLFYSSGNLDDKKVLVNMFANLKSDKMNVIVHGFTFSMTFGPRHQQQNMN